MKLAAGHRQTGRQAGRRTGIDPQQERLKPSAQHSRSITIVTHFPAAKQFPPPVQLLVCPPYPDDRKTHIFAQVEMHFTSNMNYEGTMAELIYISYDFQKRFIDKTEPRGEKKVFRLQSFLFVSTRRPKIWLPPPTPQPQPPPPHPGIYVAFHSLK